MLAIGLQFEFKSLQLLTAVPPPILTLLYKHYLNTRFANDFQYFLPQHDELSRAVIHSEEADMVGRKLEVRYDNPALENELITPMIHAKTVDYLQRILKGKIRQADLAHDIEKRSASTADKIGDVLGVTITPIHDVRHSSERVFFKLCSLLFLIRTNFSAIPFNTDVIVKGQATLTLLIQYSLLREVLPGASLMSMALHMKDIVTSPQ